MCVYICVCGEGGEGATISVGNLTGLQTEAVGKYRRLLGMGRRKTLFDYHEKKRDRERKIKGKNI